MAILSFDLCPPLPAEESVEREHYQTQQEMGFQAAYQRQEISTWRATYVWDDAPAGSIWYAQHIFLQSGDGSLPMDFAFALDGVQREVLFAREPRVTNRNAWGGRLEVELVEAL